MPVNKLRRTFEQDRFFTKLCRENMDGFFDKGLYKGFRDALNVSVANPEDMERHISSSIVPVANALNIGLIKVSTMYTTDKGRQIKAYTFFESPDGIETASLIETFRTDDNGIVNFSANPKKQHKFNEDEIQSIKLIALDIFLLLERSRLAHLVHKARVTDSMTGIPNTNSIMQHGLNLKIAKELFKYTGIFINLKNYKYINNTLGSAAGDHGIITFAQMAQAFLKDKGFIARLGGDNFFALVKNESVDPFIQKFASLDVSCSSKDILRNFCVQARMGIYPIKPTDSMGEVMHGGSVALNIAKNENGNDIVYFSPKMLEKTMHEKQVSATFLEAFNRHEFVVYYQPKVYVKNRELFGGEALVRWNMGDRIAPPAEFLPVLEKESSICQLDFYVFETVCSDLRRWIDSGITPVRISSNFSKLHLKNKFLASDILAIMKKYNIDSKYIEIELTEVSDFEDSVAMQNFVNKLREKGISVSIDDFGTGSSTLNALTNIDANIIKIDKTLLDNVGEGRDQDKIVLKNMVSLMQELHKEVIAEGVETTNQLEFLKGINCSMVQGFVYDEPLPRSEFEKRLKERRTY